MKGIASVLCFAVWPVYFSLFAQSVEQPFFTQKDSLRHKTFEELYDAFYYNFENDTLNNLYATEYIKRAYQEEDTLNIATGYYIMSYNENDASFVYYDSLIKYASFIKSDYWLWLGYYRKAKYFNKKRKFQKALENHIEAYQLAIKMKHNQSIDYSTASLGLLKERIGMYSDALSNYRKSLSYRKKLIANKDLNSVNEEFRDSYLNILHLVSNAYRLNNKLDSANQINIAFQKYRKFSWAKEYINKIRLNTAEVHFDRRQYQSAIDSSSLAIPEFSASENLKSVAVCYYIRGMSKMKLNQTKEGIRDLGKMDSIYTFLGDIYPAVRPGYEVLINYYKKQNHVSKQIQYIERLITFDSIAHENYAYISDGITNRIEKPQLIKEKNELQSQLHKSKRYFYVWSFIIILIISTFIFELIRRNRAQKRLQQHYQKQFDVLLTSIENSKFVVKNNVSVPSGNKETIGIAESVIFDILNKLKLFEEKHLYKNPKITAVSLAKNLETNANYLSRIIKYKYKKSFTEYIHHLRIELALDLLKNDRSFKNFSVKAMAKEVGFKNAEPFAKAFKNKTGMYPSNFIANLKT